MRETTALGAAIAAGFAVGVWETYDELKTINTTGRTEFTPKIGTEERDRMFRKWSKAVEMCRGWAE
jgi:glycerol kinase